MKIKKIVKKISQRFHKFNPERLKKPLFLMLLIFLMIMVLFIQDFGNRAKKETGFNSAYLENKVALENKIRGMTKGHPMEDMTYYISNKDKMTAAFLVAIAKKESDWGEHVPVLDGKDCFNYWGYRGIRDRMGSGGHTCFDSPKDAVDTVSKRLSYLIKENGIDTPKELVVWKCGRNCRSQNQEEVKKWIEDVALYYEKVVD
jgi:hypothetical protein